MRRAIELAVLAVLGLALAALWLHFARFDLGPRNGLAALLAGTAERPFVYRVLAPWLVRSLIAVTGVGALQGAELLIGASFIGWLWALRWLAQLVSLDAPMMATMLAAVPVGLLFVSGGYIYDPLMLALFTLALAMLAGRQWAAYCLLFPVLVLCRETAILLVPVYALWAWPRLRRRDFAEDLSVQLIWFVVIKVGLAVAYAGNAGSTVEFNLAAQVAFLLAYPLPNVLALSVYGACLAAALWRWDDQPAFLRAAAVVLPPMFIAYWLLGYPGEIRVFLEVFPVLYLLVWHTVWTRAALPTGQWLRLHVTRRRIGAIAESRL